MEANPPPSIPPLAAPPDSRFSPFALNAATGEAELSFFGLAVSLVRHKRLIFLMVAGSTLTAIALAFLLPPSYVAVTTVMPPQQATSSSAALLNQLGNVGPLSALSGMAGGLKPPNDIYIALMQSETVEDAMVERYELMREYHARLVSTARKTFEKHATLDGSGKDGLIHVSVRDHDPARAAQLANGYVAEYRRLSAGLAVTEAAQRRAFFEQQLQDARDNLARAEESLRQTEQSTGVIQMDLQARSLIESAATLRAQISAKEVEVQSMRTYAGNDNIQLIEAEQQLASMRAQLSKLAGNGDEASSGLMVAKGALPQTQIDYIRKLRDVKYQETIFDVLARQYEAAKLDEAKEGALIQVVDTAKPPDQKSFPRLSWFLAGGIVVGLLVACGWVCARELLDFLDSRPEYCDYLSAVRSAASFSKRG